jgi:hypothetical protein
MRTDLPSLPIFGFFTRPPELIRYSPDLKNQPAKYHRLRKPPFFTAKSATITCNEQQ